jgi:hypothetical protein
MNTHDDNLWSASLDGELSATEAAAFEQALSEEERTRLASEMKLESGLAEKLAEPVACPENLWRQTQQQIKFRSGHTARARRVRWGLVSTLAAASFLMAFMFFNREETPFIEHISAVKALQQLSQVPVDRSSVQEFLVSHDVALVLEAPEGKFRGHHPGKTLLGARTLEYEGQPVVQLLYSCCNSPVKVNVAKLGTPAADSLARAREEGTITAGRTIGDYYVASLGGHYGGEVLDLIHVPDALRV